MFNLEKDKIIDFIKRKNCGRILFQLPDGLKPKIFDFIKEIENETGSEIVISADQCYGGCDLAIEAQRLLKADALIHLGHSPMNGYNHNDILFVEARATEKIDHCVNQALKLLAEENRIGLATVIQHIDQLDYAVKILNDAGKKTYIGKSFRKTINDGQVLGCDLSTAIQIAGIVDAYLFIGGGEFHAIGIQLATKRRTIVADPYANQARDITESVATLLRKRCAAISKFQDSKKVGIVIGLKSGQIDIKSAITTKEILEKKGKECILISAHECKNEGLESFTELDALVISSCPRLPLDDQESYSRPILNLEEVHIAAGKKRWEDYGRFTF